MTTKCAHAKCTERTEPGLPLCPLCCATLPLGKHCSHCETPIASADRLGELHAVNARFRSAIATPRECRECGSPLDAGEDCARCLSKRPLRECVACDGTGLLDEHTECFDCNATGEVPDA